MARSSCGKHDFLRSGVITAVLNGAGKVDSDRQRFRRVVIGGSNASRQDLRSLVGRISRGQVESVEERMIFFTSPTVAREKLCKDGGGTVGGM